MMIRVSLPLGVFLVLVGSLAVGMVGLEPCPTPLPALTQAAAAVGTADAAPRYKTVNAFPNLRFDRPVVMQTLMVDGREFVFIVEQVGRIHVFPNDPQVSSTRLFLDMTPSGQVSRADNEEGLLGLAFHPKFQDNGQFFVYYSAKNPRRSIVSRFRVQASDRLSADPASEEQVWVSDKDPFGNHNGGCIEFGPADGYLYISLGDSGAADDPLLTGQNPKDWWGSILRIDVDRVEEGRNYAIPADNPARAKPTHAHWAPEVYAIGLRNVWKFTFDREAPHTLWAGDVGQNLWEMVHLIENGGNYGWSLYEGRHVFKPKARQRKDPAAPITKAIFEYPHSVGQSITGGYVYRGRAFPELVGQYLCGDFNTGRVWAIGDVRDGQAQQTAEIVDLRASGGARQISAFGQDQAGEVYLLGFDGQIHTLRRL
jgi:glucose/arabinose dehydrogenase